MSQLLLILVPVSSWPRVLPCLGAIVSLFLSQCLLVHEWVSPCSSASFSLSFASFFLSLYGFLQVPVSPCPRYSFSSSSFQFFFPVLMSVSPCLCASLPVSCHPYSGFFLFWFLLAPVSPVVSFFFLGQVRPLLYFDLVLHKIQIDYLRIIFTSSTLINPDFIISQLWTTTAS